MTSPSVAQQPVTGKRSSGTPVRSFRGAIILVFLLAVAAAVGWLQSPPTPPGENAPAGRFSAARAMRHVVAISRNPRPIGSLEHDAVRDYIVNYLTQTGLSPEVQKAVGVTSGPYTALAASVQNIVARLPGSGGGPAILLVAHYDSVSTGSGAADDGAGVASLLEMARAFRAGTQPRRDVIFLFTDDEESGLLGAEAFTALHPWMKSVSVVLNLEARGTSGPSIMFETSSQNGWLIDTYAHSVSHPVANSLSYEIYKRLPNDTDLTVFRKAGYAGMNFAFIEGLVNYHTARDNPQDLDPGSLQHEGESAFEVAQALANSAEDYRKRGNAVYFDVFGLRLFSYSEGAARLFAALAAVALTGLLAFGSRRKFFTFGSGLTAAVVSIAVAIAAASAAAFGVTWLFSQMAGAYPTLMAAVMYEGAMFATGATALGVAVAAAIMITALRWSNIRDLAAGGMIVWLLLTLALTFLVPGASFLLVWPLLFAVLGWWAVLLLRKDNAPAGATMLTLAALPAVVMVGSMAFMVIAAFAFGAAPIVTVPLTLLLALMAFQLRPETMPARRFLPGALAIFGLVLCVTATAGGFDANHPRFNSMIYAQNADTHKEAWVTYDRAPDSWTRQFLTAAPRHGTFGEAMPGSARPVLLSPPSQPASPLPPPSVSVIEDHAEAGRRTVRLRIASARQAPILVVHIGKASQVVRAAIDGRPLNPPAASSGEFLLQYYAAPAEGIDLELETRNPGRLQIRLADVSYGIPPLAGEARPRPENAIPTPARWNDSTIVSKSFSF